MIECIVNDVELTIEEMMVPGVCFIQQKTKHMKKERQEAQGAESEEPHESEGLVEEEEEQEPEQEQEKEEDDGGGESSDPKEGRWVRGKHACLSDFVIGYMKWKIGLKETILFKKNF